MDKRSRKRQRGAVLLEFAIIMPLLALLFSGIVEFGLAWRNVSVTTNSIRAGARTAASAGNERAADYEILRMVGAGLGDLEVATVNKVIVYWALSSDGAPPSVCTTDAALAAGGVTNSCNVYPGSELTTLDLNNFDGASCSSDHDEKWCPLGRDVSIDTATYVGVYVDITTSWVGGMFPGDGLNVTDYGVARLEPQT